MGTVIHTYRAVVIHELKTWKVLRMPGTYEAPSTYWKTWTSQHSFQWFILSREDHIYERYNPTDECIIITAHQAERWIWRVGEARLRPPLRAWAGCKIWLFQELGTLPINWHFLQNFPGRLCLSPPHPTSSYHLFSFKTDSTDTVGEGEGGMN